MNPFMVPIIAIVFGCAMVVMIVVVTHMNKVARRKMEIDTELQQMEMAYQRARQSLSR